MANTFRWIYLALLLIIRGPELEFRKDAGVRDLRLIQPKVRESDLSIRILHLVLSAVSHSCGCTMC